MTEVLIHKADVDLTIKDIVRQEVAREIRRESTRKSTKGDSTMINVLQNLRKDKNIIITRADKGNATVIMNRREYEEKVLSLLSDGPYKLLPKDPIPDVHKKVVDLCKRFVQENQMKDDTCNSLISNNKRCPIFYGSPKIHKQNIPLRPIVDYRKSPTYKLASYLVPILKCLCTDQFNLKKSYEFVDNLKSTKIRRTESLVSFDAVSLFTKVPIDETLNIINTKLKNSNEWKEITDLSVENVMTALDLCVRNTNFLWKGNYYSQQEGSAMGSPISPVFCELFLQEMETNVVLRHPYISFYRRYVDDIFAIVKSRYINQVLADLNGFHPSVQITTEIEQNESIPFLDVLLTRKENAAFGFKVYRKQTHTDKYLNYNSHHHHSQKVSVIDTLVYRAFKICDEDNISDELHHIRKCVYENKYPMKLINERISIMQTRTQRNVKPVKDREWVAIPYIGAVTYKLARILRKYLSLNLGYYTGTKLSSLLNSFKDKCTSENVCCGIYSVQCSSCSKKYIGETKRDFTKRYSEHLQHCKHLRVEQSAIALHLAEHPGNFPDNGSLVLLEKEHRQFFRKTKESLYIRKCPNKMNTNEGWKVHPVWSSTLIPLMKPV
jgi:hypothetical protein